MYVVQYLANEKKETRLGTSRNDIKRIPDGLSIYSLLARSALRQTERAVEANDRAVEVVVGNNVLYQLAKVLRVAGHARERDLAAHLVGELLNKRRGEKLGYSVVM